jgi:hypothetical protein
MQIFQLVDTQSGVDWRLIECSKGSLIHFLSHGFNITFQDLNCYSIAVPYNN